MELQSLFPSLPDSARVWIYTASRPLAEAEQRDVLQALNAFAAQWTSHGRKVNGEVAVLDGRFAVVAAVLAEGEISGCGIDASTRALASVGERLGFEWLPNLAVLYRDPDGRVQSTTRGGFRELAGGGKLDAATPVFDTSVTRLSEVRGGLFERPAGSSWHGRLLPASSAAAGA